MIKNFCFLLIGFILSIQSSSAQDKPIGFWRSHIPYSNAEDVATDGVTMFAVSKESFYTYNAATNQLAAYSKVNGMADVEMSAVAYDAATDLVVLGYKNTNIDLFSNETFYNLPDIKLKLINGVKEINDIYTDNGLAFISTSFGVVVIDLSKKEVKETYSFTYNSQTVPVKGFTADNMYYYAATSLGLYRIIKSSPNLQDFSSWQLVDARINFSNLLTYQQKVYASTLDSLFSVKNNSTQFLFKSDYEITNINAAKNGIFVNEFMPLVYVGKVKQIDTTGAIIDSFNISGKPVGVYVLASGDDKFIADEYFGLTRYVQDKKVADYRPSGPSGYGAFDILAYDKEVWVAHGSYDRQWRYIYNQDGVSRFKNDAWESFNRVWYPIFTDKKTDMIRVAKDPNDGSVYLGSYRGGLLHYKQDGTIEDLTFASPVFEGTIGDTGAYRISGLAFDALGNLWMNQFGALHELVVKTKDGQYYNFAGAGSRLAAASVLIDDYDQKWYLIPGLGVGVYNDGGTLDNKNDDQYSSMEMSNNLPSNTVYCMAKDKEGTIWVGTSDGIGIINCPGEAIKGTCQVEKRIVQYDKFAGYLFQGESVMAIAVDGANRKWIGTTNGVWLVSASADKIINRFTMDNSPMPSNTIQKIAIDPVTGDIYIGTDLGIVSYKGTAIEGTEENNKVTTFPNPIPSSYRGTIAIKGVVENADVRITDVTGQLVYRTKALGGQAVWNGLDYKGRRPQSGVYLIFVTNAEGSQTYTGKMVFME